jgi:hypothetical protein
MGTATAALLTAPFVSNPEIVAPVAGEGDGVPVNSVPGVPGAVGDFGVDPPHAAARTQMKNTGRNRRSRAVMGALPLPIPLVGTDPDLTTFWQS